MKIRTSTVILASAAAWLIFNILVKLDFNTFFALDIFGLLALFTIPGLLFWTGLGQLKKLQWQDACYIFGSSLLLMVLAVLVGNTFLPFVGIHWPLDQTPILGTLNFLIIMLFIFAWRKQKTLIQVPSLGRWNGYDVTIISMGLSLIGLSTLGAISLNNGGSNFFTLTMIALAGLFISLLVLWRDKLKPSIIPAGIYLLALAFLFMTSLRGWYITGHDIQREFRVMELAKNTGAWSMSNFRDAYNACMSITILPAIFGNLLKQPDPYVFKIYFQMIFALVPSMIYLIARRYTSTAIAVLGSIYFITFPTFINDMTSLNRQEIAFLYIALMILIAFDENLRIRTRRAIFVWFGLGMVLSHYSTTYSMIAILALSTVTAWFIKWLSKKPIRKIIISARSGILEFATDTKVRFIVTPIMVILLTGLCVIWTGVITGTSAGLGNTLSETYKALSSGINSTRSSDATKLVSGTIQDPQKELDTYVTANVDRSRQIDSPETYFPDADFSKYPAPAIMPEKSAVTALSQSLSHIGINLPALNANLKKVLPYLLALFTVIGFFYVLRRRKLASNMHLEYFTLGIASLIFVILQIVLPVLSVEYGLLRAFQQSLMILGVFIVVGSTVIFAKFPKRWQIILPAIISLIFLISDTGFLTQLAGGYMPQTNLNNAGLDYDIYYTHNTEVAGINWLVNTVTSHPSTKQNHYEVQADKYFASKITSISNPNTIDEIYPSLIRTDSYVILGYTTVTKQQATLSYSGDLVTYKYPLSFLDDNKDLVYSSNGSRVYR